MWIYFNDAALSVVKHNSLPNTLLVRSRTKGDIESIFPSAEVKRTELADYRFRANIPVEEVAAAIGQKILDIDYLNFKNSVDDEERHDVYMSIWSAGTKLERVSY